MDKHCSDSDYCYRSQYDTRQSCSHTPLTMLNRYCAKTKSNIPALVLCLAILDILSKTVDLKVCCVIVCACIGVVIIHGAVQTVYVNLRPYFMEVF